MVDTVVISILSVTLGDTCTSPRPTISQLRKFWPRECKAAIPMTASSKTTPDKVPSHQDLMSETVSAMCHPQSLAKGQRQVHCSVLTPLHGIPPELPPLCVPQGVPSPVLCLEVITHISQGCHGGRCWMVWFTLYTFAEHLPWMFALFPDSGASLQRPPPGSASHSSPYLLAAQLSAL